MKQRILPLMALAAILVAMLCPFRAQAQEAPSLTLYYQQESHSFPDISVGIYRVAEVGGDYPLVAPYDSFPVEILDITDQAQWDQLAETLWAYMVDNQVVPDREGLTDQNGAVVFSDLEPGVYFVREARAEKDGGTYIFRKFLVFVPTPNLDGTYTYAVEARPKCTRFVPHEQYSVTKLWQDTGNQAIRPKAVTVKIYRDGVLQETKVLSSDNTWRGYRGLDRCGGGCTQHLQGEDPGERRQVHHREHLLRHPGLPPDR